MTENSEDVFASAVPYLVSVESPYEEEATHQNEKKAFSISQFTSAIRTSYPSEAFGQITADSIRITERSDGNRVRNMRIGSGSLTGRQVREALGLSSANFTIDVSGDTITFTSNGSGHGVGMSQYGADGMAKNGYDYKKNPVPLLQRDRTLLGIYMSNCSVFYFFSDEHPLQLQ